MSVSIRIQRGELIHVPVHLRHRAESFREMVLDTGSRLSIVAPDLAEKIGLDPQEEPGAEIVGVAGSAPLLKATVAEVSLLGQTVRELEVICHPLHPALGLHGVLGMNFLRHFNVRIDNDSETIELERRRG